MNKIFHSLLFKGVVIHLLLFVFVLARDIAFHSIHVQSLVTYYLASLIIVVLVLFQPSQMIDRVSSQLDGLINGDYAKHNRPHGHSDLAHLYDKVQTLGDDIFRTQSNLENQRNQLDSVLTYMVDGVIATDRRGNIILANTAAQNYLDLSQEEVIGSNITHVLKVKDQFSFYDLLEQEPEVVIDSTTSLGEAVSLKVKFVPFRRESGFISGIIAVLHDTTDQEKIEREQRQFVSNVSHELRTPLTSVKAYLEALEDGAIDDREVATSFIDVSLNETNRMIRMISDLLVLSRIDQQRLELNKEVINFTAFLDFQVKRLRRVTQTEPLSLRPEKFNLITHFPQKAIWVEIDTDKITQVVDNIVSNSFKYSPHGGDITLSLELQGNHVVLTISDQGMGIPKADLNKIFKRFYRVDAARNSQTGGTGLGLSIVKNIIAMHNGTITATSEGENKGTSFIITLPYSEDLSEFDNAQDWDDAENSDFDDLDDFDNDFDNADVVEKSEDTPSEENHVSAQQDETRENDGK